MNHLAETIAYTYARQAARWLLIIAVVVFTIGVGIGRVTAG